MAELVRDTRVAVPIESRAISIDYLNECLANTLYAVLASKFAHWNVKGPGFHPAHLLFDKVYGFYAEAADILGERITAIGGSAEGMLNDVASNSTIAYTAGASDNVATHMKAMADMLGQVANGYRYAIDVTLDGEVRDYATQDVFIQLARDADKLLYFLEAELRDQ